MLSNFTHFTVKNGASFLITNFRFKLGKEKNHNLTKQKEEKRQILKKCIFWGLNPHPI
jgi:hypothetical protein